MNGAGVGLELDLIQDLIQDLILDQVQDLIQDLIRGVELFELVRSSLLSAVGCLSNQRSRSKDVDLTRFSDALLRL